MALPRRSIAVIGSVLLLLVLSGLFSSRTKLRDGVRNHVGSYKNPFTSLQFEHGSIRQKIWQTSKNSSKMLDPSLKANVIKWHSLNPQWQYEMLDDDACLRYVQRRFERDEPAFFDVFSQLQDPIMRADLFRYLVLYGDGGVYSDIDTEALQPIDQWIPAQYKNRTNVVLGVEYDTYGQGKGMALLDLQLANWTLLARKGHGLFKLTIKRAIEAIAELAKNQNIKISGIKPSFNDVLAGTGPTRLTVATWEYLSQELGEDFGWQNASGLNEPKLVGDVLIMPVTSFGNGQGHSFAKPPTDPQALVHHQFRGDWKHGTHAYDNMKEADKSELEVKGPNNNG